MFERIAKFFDGLKTKTGAALIALAGAIDYISQLDTASIWQSINLAGFADSLTKVATGILALGLGGKIMKAGKEKKNDNG